jgi:hypothetical protein
VEALLHPFADAVAEDWMEEEKSIVARYTMQRELDAHKRISAGSKNTAKDVGQKQTRASAPVAQEVAEDGFDDNVELF